MAPFADLVTTNIVPSFGGPPTPPEIIAWLYRASDSFDSFQFLNPSLKPQAVDKIRFAGTALEEKDMMMWWNANRETLLKLTTWDAFVAAVKKRFITDAWRLQELIRFSRIRQDNREFTVYAREVLLAQDILSTSTDKAYILDDAAVIRHLLFFANPILMRRTVDLPNFTFETIKRDELVSLMTFQWDLMKSEGVVSGTQPWESI